MRCRTPAVNLANIPDEGTPIPIGFRMDNTLVIRHMYDDENQIRGSLMYYPDFTVDKFDNNTTTWSTTSSPTTTDGTHYLRITVSTRGSYTILHHTPFYTILHHTPFYTILHHTPSYTILHHTPYYTILHHTPFYTILHHTPFYISRALPRVMTLEYVGILTSSNYAP